MITWIASYPKSGNTWVRLFLMAYQDPARFDINQRPGNFRYDMERWAYRKASPILVEKLTSDEARLLRGAALLHLTYAFPRRYRCFMKTHSANVSTNGTAWIPPEMTGKSIYVMRDPRDVAVSFADHLGLMIDASIERLNSDQSRLDRGDEELHSPVMSWSTHVQSWAKPTPFIKMMARYEDLLAAPAASFAEILDFLEIEFDQERFDRALELTTFDSLKQTEQKHGFEATSRKQKKFFRVGKAGQWRNILSADQAAAIEGRHAETMAEWGYLPRRDLNGS